MSGITAVWPTGPVSLSWRPGESVHHEWDSVLDEAYREARRKIAA